MTIQLNNIFADSEVFSEYDGDQIYNDFTIDGGDVTVLRSYEPGVGHVTDPLDPANRVTKYYHPDKIGTTRALTSGSSALSHASVYTAFGELVDGTNHRYGYAGTSGYQAHDEFSLLHVGARYYDPAIARFVQRDPIGIQGGFNVYAYVSSRPTILVDPSGEFWVPAARAAAKKWAPKAARGAWKGAKWAGRQAKSAAQWTGTKAGQGWRWAKHNVRWERHQLPGYRNFHGGVCHLNIGKKHIIIDARVWWAKIKSWL